MAAPARQQKVLRIGIIQEGKIVQERLVKAGESVTVGESPKNTFVLPVKKLPRKEYPLFVASRTGYVLNFTQDMKGKISSGGAVVGLDKLRNDPSVTRKAGNWRLPLTEQDRGKITLDDVTVLFQFVPPPPTQAVTPMVAMDFRARLVDDEDPIFLGFMAIFTALAAVLLVWVWNTEPPEVKSLAEIPDRFTKLVMEPPEPTELPEPEIDLDAEGPDSKAKAKAEEEQPKKSEGKAEEPKTEKQKAEAREALKQQVAEKSLVIKMFVTRGENANGSYAEDLWSEGDEGLGDLDAAVKGVRGVEVATGDNQGLRTGQNGDRTDAGLDSETQIDGGSTTVSGGPDVAVSGTVEMGGLDPASVGNVEAIKDVVERNFGQLTFCYEVQLKSDPNLGGRVEVEWVVSRGRVTSASVFTNTTGNDELGECIVDKIKRWRFPADMEEEVIFPFVFKRKG